MYLLINGSPSLTGLTGHVLIDPETVWIAGQFLERRREKEQREGGELSCSRSGGYRIDNLFDALSFKPFTRGINLCWLIPGPGGVSWEGYASFFFMQCESLTELESCSATGNL